MKRRIQLLVLLVALVLTACQISSIGGGGEIVTGSGTMVTETREVSRTAHAT